MRERKRLEGQLAIDNELVRRTGDIDAYFELAREGESGRARAGARDQVPERVRRSSSKPHHALRRDRSAQRHRDRPSRRRRHRIAGLGRDADAHVPALGRAPRLQDRDERLPGWRRSGHQVRYLHRHRRVRLRAACRRNRRPSPGAHLALRLRPSAATPPSPASLSRRRSTTPSTSISSPTNCASTPTAPAARAAST